MPDWNRLSDIHIWDLTTNSTRFDQASAAPSDDALHTQWTGTAIIAAIVAFFTFLLMISILRVPNVRNKSFNCYILAVVLPDFQFSLSCSVTCMVNAIGGYYRSEAMCGWQTWYAVFGFAASCWMNAVISHQLYTMLRVSHFGGRYVPPTIRKVAAQTMCVYAYGACLASLAVWNVVGLPFKSGIYQGYACLPKDYDDASTIFFWLGFLPACVLIPLAYVLFCIIRIYRGGMLPPEGQRSTLWMYFSLIFVFVAMWLPFIVITFVWGPASPGVDSTWVLWSGAQFSHLQGLATVWTILFKPDIRAAFLGTITCGKWHGCQEEERSQHQSGSNSRTRPPRTCATRASTDQTPGTHDLEHNQPKKFSMSRFSSSRLESINEILCDTASRMGSQAERWKDMLKTEETDDSFSSRGNREGKASIEDASPAQISASKDAAIVSILELCALKNIEINDRLRRSLHGEELYDRGDEENRGELRRSASLEDVVSDNTK